METQTELEARATRNLVSRGLTRDPERLAFVYRGHPVTVTIDQSVYRGFYVTVHDGHRPPHQYRAHLGEYDWDEIATHIKQIADSHLPRPVAAPVTVTEQNQQLADELATITGAGPSSRLSIKPSDRTPGRVRVKLDEVELDPVSVIQLYAAVSRSLPGTSDKPSGSPAGTPEKPKSGR
jgi:hypothetical protein